MTSNGQLPEGTYDEHCCSLVVVMRSYQEHLFSEPQDTNLKLKTFSDWKNVSNVVLVAFVMINFSALIAKSVVITKTVLPLN